MKILFILFSEWKTSAVIFKKCYFIVRFYLFLFTDFSLIF
ncbi:hypothetical protein N406_08180 [Helicobacter pylori FD577]|nr:hypothetical protein N406_08180 [Helicobacter pylori FD577]